MKRRNLLKGALAASLLSTAAPAFADTTYMTFDGFPPASGPGQIGVAFTQAVQKSTEIELQVSVGKAATKSAIDAAMAKVDLFHMFPTINHLMANKIAMYAQVENAPELSKNLRSIFAYPLGPYHIVVYADSGITKLEDLAGKKVFLGPPGGSATNTMTQLVEAATGLKEGEDYELMRFDWKSAETAFLDRQMDVFATPTSVPSAQVQQFALTTPIRLLGVSDEALASDSLKQIMGLPGRTVEIIPAGAYDNQVNEEGVKSIGNWGGIGTHVGTDPEVIYQITKAFWENIADVQATAKWMEVMTPEIAFTETNVPLHPGAYRYYKEAGYDIPESIIPEEAK